VFRHQLLLLPLIMSMFIGMALCCWTLVAENKSGLYLELIFVDGFLNFGQGIINCKVLIINILIRLVYMRRLWPDQLPIHVASAIEEAEESHLRKRVVSFARLGRFGARN